MPKGSLFSDRAMSVSDAVDGSTAGIVTCENAATIDGSPMTAFGYKQTF